MADVDPAVKPKFEALVVDVFSGETGDVIAELRIPRETMAVGGKIPFSFTRRVACETCAGRGQAGEQPCKACEGGFTKVEATVEVDVPPGSGAGMQVRVPGQGHIRPDKPQGDVVVVLATAAPEVSPAAQKLPSFIVLVIITIVILVLALRMAR